MLTQADQATSVAQSILQGLVALTSRMSHPQVKLGLMSFPTYGAHEMVVRGL